MRPLAILLVLVVAIGLPLWMLLTLVGILWGWCEETAGWMQRRSWRYSVGELLLAMTVTAVILAGLATVVRLLKSAN